LLKNFLLKFVGVLLLIVAIFSFIAVIGTIFYLWANVIALGTSGSVTFFSILWVLLKTAGYAFIYGAVGFLSYMGVSIIGDELIKRGDDEE
jgi:hypothetical protein